MRWQRGAHSRVHGDADFGGGALDMHKVHRLLLLFLAPAAAAQQEEPPPTAAATAQGKQTAQHDARYLAIVQIPVQARVDAGNA